MNYAKPFDIKNVTARVKCSVDEPLLSIVELKENGEYKL